MVINFESAVFSSLKDSSGLRNVPDLVMVFTPS